MTEMGTVREIATDLIVRRSHLGTCDQISSCQATPDSRRFHYPEVESIYSASEIKQTLGFTEPRRCDEEDGYAVKAGTSTRTHHGAHITENQHIPMFDFRPGHMLNPLCTAVHLQSGLRTNCPFKIWLDALVPFFAHLNRDQMVNMLCVLDEGTAWYSLESGNPLNATYMWDRQQKLILQVNRREPHNSFYRSLRTIARAPNSVRILGFANLSGVYGQPPPSRDVIRYDESICKPKSVMAK